MPKSTTPNDPALVLRVQLALHDARPGVVARRVGIDAPTMSRILPGHERPNDERFNAILKAIRRG